ncbi:MAG: hypothetical protein WC762_04370 [Methylobacter sp.]|jgi:transcriptional regulator with XRE-family HTH domain
MTQLTTTLNSSFKEWRQTAQYSIEDCQRIFCVTKRTINNWESERIKPPRAVFICLMLFAGRLDHLGKQWRGFRITPEYIESPEGDFVHCQEIRALRYAFQALDIKRDKILRTSENKPENVIFLPITKKKTNTHTIKKRSKITESRPRNNRRKT